MYRFIWLALWRPLTGDSRKSHRCDWCERAMTPYVDWTRLTLRCPLCSTEVIWWKS